MIKKLYVVFLKKTEMLSSVSIRLVKLTNKHSSAIHPKHLVHEKIWYSDKLSKKDDVLDLGSGNGADLVKIAKKIHTGLGLELNKKSLAISQNSITNTKNVKFLEFDLNNKLPFKDSSFSAVICSDVLEHITKRSQLISEIYRVLKKKGLLFMVTDNPTTSWKLLQKSVGIFFYADREHKYEYPKQKIVSLLSKNKFKILSVNSSTYDTPFKGFIDLSGGISISLYKELRKWKKKKVALKPEETTSYKIMATK